MKTVLLMLIVIVLISGCKRLNESNELSQSQLDAIAVLKSSYQRAVQYNDSLINSVAANTINPDNSRIFFFDRQFHHYVEVFDSCHHRFEHNNISANHSHNSAGWVVHNSGSGMMGGGMCRCCANGGHSWDLHQQMKILLNQHAQYHPR